LTAEKGRRQVGMGKLGKVESTVAIIANVMIVFTIALPILRCTLRIESTHIDLFYYKLWPSIINHSRSILGNIYDKYD
jgi:hypothetical protein